MPSFASGALERWRGLAVAIEQCVVRAEVVRWAQGIVGAPRVWQGICKLILRKCRSEPGGGTGGTGRAELFWTAQSVEGLSV